MLRGATESGEPEQASGSQLRPLGLRPALEFRQGPAGSEEAVADDEAEDLVLRPVEAEQLEATDLAARADEEAEEGAPEA